MSGRWEQKRALKWQLIPSRYEYTDLGRVTEFRASAEIGRAMRGRNNLAYMDSWGPDWGFLPSDKAVVFVENHDSERGGGEVLTYKDGKLYRMAVAFTLAHPFGVPKVMSGFEFDRSDQGPPADRNGNILSPDFAGPTCGNRWVCQHRWQQVGSMIRFRNCAGESPMSYWWSDGSNQIAFAREGRSFVAFNNEEKNLNVTLKTSLPGGTYCDIITGELKDKKCTGRVVKVDEKGMGNIFIAGNAKEGVLAIILGERLK